MGGIPIVAKLVEAVKPRANAKDEGVFRVSAIQGFFQQGASAQTQPEGKYHVLRLSCAYVCMYVCMYVYIHTYIHTYINT